MSAITEEEFGVLIVGAGEQTWDSQGPAVKAAGHGIVSKGLADTDPRQLAHTAEILGIDPAKTYPSLTEALARDPSIRGVILAVPTNAKEALTFEALRAGMHVLVEKPFGRDPVEALRMMNAAEHYGLVLRCGYQYRYMQPALLDFIRNGELEGTFRTDGRFLKVGKIPGPRHFWPHGAGADYLGHLLSVINLGMPGLPARVTAHTWNQFGTQLHGAAFENGHDTLEALLTYDDGRAAHALVAWDFNPFEPDTTEDMRVEFHAPTRSVKVPLMGDAEDVQNHFPKVAKRHGHARLRETLSEPLPVQTEDTYVLQLRDWVAAARGGRSRGSARYAYEIEATIDAALRSARQGGVQTHVRLG